MPLLGWEKVSREDPAFKACTAVTTGVGAIVGGASLSPAGPLGIVGGYAAGAAYGLAFGYLACPYLVPAIRRRIESGMPLSDAEVRSAAEAMGRYADLREATDAVRLVGVVKSLPVGLLRVGAACQAPALTARRVLGKV